MLDGGASNLLNTSSSSGGFALDDLVSKILDDDRSLFAFNNVTDLQNQPVKENVGDSDPFRYIY